MKVLGIWLHWLCTITAIHSLPLSFSTSSGTWGQLPCPTHRAVWIWQIMTGIMVSTNGRGGHSLLFVSSLRRIQKELETSSLFSVHPLSWSELGSISTCYTKRFSRMTCSCSGFWDVCWLLLKVHQPWNEYKNMDLGEERRSRRGVQKFLNTSLTKRWSLTSFSLDMGQAWWFASNE